MRSQKLLFAILRGFRILFGAWIVAVFPARFWEKGLNKCKDLEAKGASPSLKRAPLELGNHRFHDLRKVSWRVQISWVIVVCLAIASSNPTFGYFGYANG